MVCNKLVSLSSVSFNALFLSAYVMVLSELIF